MASWRVRSPAVNSLESSVTFTQTAGATTGQVDLFFDNSDIKSKAQIINIMKNVEMALDRAYRLNIGGAEGA